MTATYQVSLALTKMDFRQNYTPDRPVVPTARHWMLDFAPGRDLLKAALRKTEPQLEVPFFRDVADLDPKLDAMVDSLGLRDMAKPASAVEELQATAKFFKLMVVTSLKGLPVTNS